MSEPKDSTRRNGKTMTLTQLKQAVLEPPQNGTGPRKVASTTVNNKNGAAKVAKNTQPRKRKNRPVQRKLSRLAEQSILDLLPVLQPSPDIKPEVTKQRKKPGRKPKVVAEFIEPELAEPTPAYTGVPLEEGPLTKIKKESLWPSKSAGPKKVGRTSGPSSRESTVSEEPADLDPVNDAKHKKSLKTSISDKVTKASEVREPLKLKIKSTRAKVKTPKQPKREANSNDTPVRVSKRIKVISPKKPASTNLAPSGLPHVTGHQDEDDPTKDNDEFCSSCGGPGIFLCCETCPRSFHFTCCDPPLEEPPEDDWYCRECLALRNPSITTKWNEIGIFSQLMNQQESRNPVEFQLPKNIRDNTFIGVTTGDNGEYEDDTFKPELSYTKANGSQVPGFNKNNDLEIDSLYDKDGKPYLCHKCGESGLYHRTLVHCDYCPLVWHIDCLEEPMFGPKTIGLKWRCPNHVESLLPPGFIKQRRFKDIEVLEPMLRNHFLQLAHYNNFLIKYDDQPHIKQGYMPNLQDYLNYEEEDFSKPNPRFMDRNSDQDDENEPHENFKVPDYLDRIESTNSGILAKTSKKLNKVLCLGEQDAFIYRVPEKSILLDFVTKVNQQKLNIIETINCYDNQARLETNEDEREIVDTLIEIKTKPTQKLDFDDLVSHALKDNANSKGASTDLSESEISDLQQIKKLMELKGRDSLLKFLQS